jgi:K+-sensing histidine kinase KdpD
MLPSSSRPGVEVAGATDRRSQRAWLVWLPVLTLVTLGMLRVRASLQEAHVALAYLLVILGASASGGRMLGLTLAGVAFGCFNYFFVPPYQTFSVAEPIDMLVLAAFLVTSVVAAQLLARAQTEAAAARARAAEVDRLSMLGSEALNAGVPTTRSWRSPTSFAARSTRRRARFTCVTNHGRRPAWRRAAAPRRRRLTRLRSRRSLP